MKGIENKRKKALVTIDTNNWYFFVISCWPVPAHLLLDENDLFSATHHEITARIMGTLLQIFFIYCWSGFLKPRSRILGSSGSGTLTRFLTTRACTPRLPLHGIDSLWEINSAVELILGDIDSMWRNWTFQNCHRHMLFVGGSREGTPNWSNICNTHRKQYGSCRQGMKSRFLL